MANIKSSLKRIGITKRNTLRNKYYKSIVKNFIKKYLISLISYKSQKTDVNLQSSIKILNSVYSKLDKATKAKVVHKNSAARKKSALKLLLTVDE